mgnify:CR=1 FL=1
MTVSETLVSIALDTVSIGMDMVSIGVDMVSIVPELSMDRVSILNW